MAVPGRRTLVLTSVVLMDVRPSPGALLYGAHRDLSRYCGQVPRDAGRPDSVHSDVVPLPDLVAVVARSSLCWVLLPAPDAHPHTPKLAHEYMSAWIQQLYSAGPPLVRVQFGRKSAEFCFCEVRIWYVHAIRYACFF